MARSYLDTFVRAMVRSYGHAAARSTMQNKQRGDMTAAQEQRLMNQVEAVEAQIAEGQAVINDLLNNSDEGVYETEAIRKLYEINENPKDFTKTAAVKHIAAITRGLSMFGSSLKDLYLDCERIRSEAEQKLAQAEQVHKSVDEELKNLEIEANKRKAAKWVYFLSGIATGVVFVLIYHQAIGA